MPFDVKRKFFAHSDRSVQGIDWHPTEPWLLTGDDFGTVKIYNIESGAVIDTFEVTNCPVVVKFIARNNWFVAGSSDGQLYVFNYSTHEKVIAFQAHSDRGVFCLVVHPTDPIVFTGDYLSVKAWDWRKRWRNILVHQCGSYFSHVAFNPKDYKTFVTACYDGTVKMWSMTSPIPVFSINAHNKCVRYVEFYPGNRPYFVTASDDMTIKVWLSTSCVQIINGHTDKVNFAIFHPDMPVIISGSWDGTVKFWKSKSYGVKCVLTYSFESAPCIALRKDTNEIAVGFNDGVLTLEIGYSGPEFSIDHAGKLLYTRQNKVLSADLDKLDITIATSVDGVRIPLQAEYLGSTEILASSILHSSDGRFVTVVSDSEFIIYNAEAWRKDSSGTGISFAWAPDPNTYAVLESGTKLNIYKGTKLNMNKIETFENFMIDALYTGPFLGARGRGHVVFGDWDTAEIVGMIDVDVKNIYWSSAGTHVAMTSSNTLYIYYFDHHAYQDRPDKQLPSVGDESTPKLFTLLFTLHESIQSAKWVGDCLIYTTPTHLCYSIISSTSPIYPPVGHDELESYIISPVDNRLYLLSYISEHGKVYVVDDDMKVYGFGFSFAVVEFQLAILKGNVDGARGLLRKMTNEQVKMVVKFSEGRGLKKLLCTTFAMELIATKTTNKLISQLIDNEAQDMADFLSWMVGDKETLTQYERRHPLHLLSKLAKSAQVFPQSLELGGVECNLTNPVAWGGYGVIYKGEHEGSPVCVKAVQVDSRGIDRTKLTAHASELIIWAHLLHPNVLPFLGIYASKEEVSRICIVSPWINNGDLLQYLQKVPDVPRKPLARDIIAGLQYLHDFDIIHADLKAKNVLVSETGRAVLTDFGISRLSMTQTTTSTNAAGSLNWMAPELLLDDKLPSRESDIWAFACTCFEIITLTVPFSQYHSYPLLLRAFRKGNIIPLKSELGIGWDEDVWSVGMRCWQRDPASRPGAHALLDMIKSFSLSDDRLPDPNSQRTRNYTEIDHDHILSILIKIRQSAPVWKEEEEPETDVLLAWLKRGNKKARELLRAPRFRR